LGLLTRKRKGEISLEVIPDLPEDAFELARFWMTTERSYVAVAYEKQWPPELFGSIMVESITTAARSVAAHTGLTQEEALQAIWRGFDEERERLKDVH
jgi:hypothetical protein